MLDIGWTELLIIGVVALIVVGPKDLPKMFRTLGQVTGKARAMAREFQSAMDAAADETGVKDIARDLRDTASGRSLRESSGVDDLEREFRDMEREFRSTEKPAAKARVKNTGHDNARRDKGAEAKAAGDGTARGASPAGASPARRAGPDPAAGNTAAGNTAADNTARDEFDEEGADEALVADLDDLASRNAATSAREAERMKRAESAAAARRKAAQLRARRDAEQQVASPDNAGGHPITARADASSDPSSPAPEKGQG